MSENNNILSVSQAARRLRLPAKWLKQEVEAGRLPHLKTGLKRHVNIDAIREILSTRAATENLHPVREVSHA